MGKHEVSHLDIEQPLFPRGPDGRPHIWIQWKGTNVCCDIHCKCGAHLHYDGDFMYFIKCPHCKQTWEVGTHVPLYPVLEDPNRNCVAEPMEDDSFETRIRL